MKKILIIAYYFPPDTYAAALRPMGIAKYLPEFGWEPIILTSKLPYDSRDDLKKKMNIIEVPPFDIFSYVKQHLGISTEKPKVRFNYGKNNIKKTIKTFLTHQFKTIVAFPDRHNGWYRIALKAADEILSKERIDFIFSTSFPWTSAIVARRLKVKYGIPWLADFQDLWTQYHRYSFNRIRRYLETLLEKWTLDKADVLVMCSEERANKWRKIHPRKKIIPITLGFNPDDFECKIIKSNSSRFVITYAGNIKEKHNIEPLFKAISELLFENKIVRDMIEIRFWGSVPSRVKDLVISYKIGDIVKFNNIIPRKDIIQKMMESTLLLLLTWDDPKEPGIHPAKLFDYLGAKVPILAIGKYPNIVEQVLQETKAGIYINRFEKLKLYLTEAFVTFEKIGKLPYNAIGEEVEKYTDKSITKQYVNILDSVNEEGCNKSEN